MRKGKHTYSGLSDFLATGVVVFVMMVFAMVAVLVPIALMRAILWILGVF